MRDLRHLPARQEQEELTGSVRELSAGRNASAGWLRRGIVVVTAIAVISAVASGVTLCPVAALGGFPCPGCGLSRAALALVSGNFATAYALHPLVFLALPLVAFVGLRILRDLWRPPSGPPPVNISGPWMATGAALVLVALLSVWVARFGGALGGPVPVDPWFRY